MKLIVGLGNPGNRYLKTRHNAGFMAADFLISAWNAHREKSSLPLELYRSKVLGEDVLIAKPQTFMNLSGQAAAPLLRFYKLSAQDLLVIHDELDLDPMVFRIKKGGGTGGHNGLLSLDESLGKESTGYIRFRIGIGKPSTVQSRLPTEDYVLAPFSTDEGILFQEILPHIQSAAELWLQGSLTQAMNQFNQKKKNSSEEDGTHGI